MLRRHPIRAMTVFMNQGARPGQEDFALASQERGIFVVADGFGGPVAGAEAARSACEAVRSFLEKEAGDREATLPFVIRSYFSLAGNVLFNALIHSNRKVNLLNKGKNVHEKGGASVIAGFIDEDLLAIANVGACSAWMFRNGKGAELVVPRSYARLCDPYSPDPAETLRAPLMAMGMAEDLEPEIFEYRIRNGDWLLMHTDGLGSDVREKVLEIHRSGKRASEAVQEAVSALRGYDYPDNVAAALVVF